MKGDKILHQFMFTGPIGTSPEAASAFTMVLLEEMAAELGVVELRINRRQTTVICELQREDGEPGSLLEGDVTAEQLEAVRRRVDEKLNKLACAAIESASPKTDAAATT